MVPNVLICKVPSRLLQPCCIFCYFDYDGVGLNVLRCWADILGTVYGDSIT